VKTIITHIVVSALAFVATNGPQATRGGHGPGLVFCLNLIAILNHRWFEARTGILSYEPAG